MSQLEQQFNSFLNRHPEIRPALSKNILNTRALAREFMREENIKLKHIEAVVAMIRRSNYQPLLTATKKEIFQDIKINFKDEISILNYDKNIVTQLDEVISNINYNKNETLKIVIGSESVKVFIDSSKKKLLTENLEKKYLIKEHKNVSEASLLFGAKASDEKGIVAYVTSELLLAGINILEILTSSPELIIYFEEKQSIKAFEVFKKIKQL